MTKQLKYTIKPKLSFKYKLGDKIWYMDNNRPQEATIIGRKLEEGIWDRVEYTTIIGENRINNFTKKTHDQNSCPGRELMVYPIENTETLSPIPLKIRKHYELS